MLLLILMLFPKVSSFSYFPLELVFCCVIFRRVLIFCKSCILKLLWNYFCILNSYAAKEVAKHESQRSNHCQADRVGQQQTPPTYWQSRAPREKSLHNDCRRQPISTTQQ